MKKIIGILVFAVCAFGVAFAQELTGREIMQKASNREKAVTDSFKMRMTLINSSGKKRVLEVLAYSKDYGRKSSDGVFTPCGYKRYRLSCILV